MASAQGSKKKGHLEAGKKKLEEFRQKKAAEQAKKAASTSQVHTSEAGSNEKQHVEPEDPQHIGFDAVGKSDSVGACFSEPSAIVIKNDAFETNNSKENSFNFPNNAGASIPDSANHFDISSSVQIESDIKGKEFRSDGDRQLNLSSNIPSRKQNVGATESAPSGRPSDQHSATLFPSIGSVATSRQSSYLGVDGKLPNNDDDVYFKGLPEVNSRSSEAIHADGFCENPGSRSQYKSGYGDHLVYGSTPTFSEDFTHSGSGTAYFPEVRDRVGAQESSVVPDQSQSKFNGSPLMATASNSSTRSGDSNYTGFSSSNYGQIPLSSAGTNIKRSRSSFLDSINISKGHSASPPLSETSKVEPLNSKIFPEDTLGSSFSQNSAHSIPASANGVDPFKQDFYSRKQDEDFAALEQHIEDLTQEKFSLQRALEASRTLAESLAAENSALTDTYNQQGSVVSQLKSDMEKLQDEIKANLVELESFRIQYANAQLECNAADERAKLLASEVIGLEEKALRLRSNELKLKRQLEDSQAEISSFKKKMLSLEKDRQDLQFTIDALQEEKKLLLSKLRKASTTGKFVDVAKSSTDKRDASTSTGDLGETNVADVNDSISNVGGSLRDEASINTIVQENVESGLEDLSMALPLDQIRIIENIRTLISELTLEKEELVRTLSAESSQSSKLKELNKELTRKLETQTQSLELLTSQSMVHEGIPLQIPDSRPLLENTTYADEGDEVVERVLGWIMKLFPGGSSRRRTSKLL